MEQGKRYYRFTPKDLNGKEQSEIALLLATVHIGCEFPKRKRTDLVVGICLRATGVKLRACFAFREKWDYLQWMEDGTLPPSDEYERKVCQVKPK